MGQLAQLGTGGKAHYAALDGLRAIAALAVLYLHQLGLFARDFTPPPPLAVDFFFMLSGFVLAHAYGRKLDEGLSWSRYMAARIVRVYPMLFLGVVLGGLLALARGTHGHAGPDQNVLTFLASLVLAPVGLLYVAKDYPYDSPNVFPFNGIVWSLFFAMVASAVYASPVRKLSRRTLIACFILCCIAWAAAGIWAGSISGLGRHGLIGFLGGFPRVAVPFAIGAALYSLAAYRALSKRALRRSRSRADGAPHGAVGRSMGARSGVYLRRFPAADLCRSPVAWRPAVQVAGAAFLSIVRGPVAALRGGGISRQNLVSPSRPWRSSPRRCCPAFCSHGLRSPFMTSRSVANWDYCSSAKTASCLPPSPSKQHRRSSPTPGPPTMKRLRSFVAACRAPDELEFNRGATALA